jgi:hypothetical protein
MSLGSAPSLLRDELNGHIREAIEAHPRSQQKLIGPSELGTTCPRKLAYRLAQIPELPRSPAWRPTVGTAVHAWLADAMVAANATVGFTRYLVETTVTVGTVRGIEITGTADLYDRVTATVVDWKVVGPNTLRLLAGHGVDPLYQTQLNLYRLGFLARGAPVESLAVYYLPANGELSQGVYKPVAIDEQAALGALARSEAVLWAIEAAGAEPVIRGAATAPDRCQWCAWYRPGSNNPMTGCPGHNER